MIPSCYRRTHNDTTYSVLLLVTTSTQPMGSTVASHGMPVLLDCTAALPSASALHKHAHHPRENIDHAFASLGPNSLASPSATPSDRTSQLSSQQHDRTYPASSSVRSQDARLDRTSRIMLISESARGL